MNGTKYCPLRFTHHAADWGCEEEDCAWWNGEFQMCCAAVDAYLKAEAHRRTHEFGTKDTTSSAPRNGESRPSPT